MKIEMIAHAQITPNADQPRKHFDQAALDELAESIRQSGLLQPITVRPHFVPLKKYRHAKTGDACRVCGALPTPGFELVYNEGVCYGCLPPQMFEIVAGERRWRACGIAGIQMVPCIVRDLDDREAFIIATMENVARADMNPIEEANALRRLLDLPMTPQEIEGRIGMAANIVTWKASLTRCVESVQHLVARGHFPVAQAISMSRLSPDGQAVALREYQQRRLTQLEFTEVVNVIHAREHNLEMFAETKISPAARAQAERFRAELRRISAAAAALEGLDFDELAPAVLHDAGAIIATVEEAAKVLARSRTRLLRAKGREQGKLIGASQ